MMLCSRVVRTVSGPLTAGAASEVSTLGGIVLGYRLMVSGAMGQRKNQATGDEFRPSRTQREM